MRDGGEPLEKHACGDGLDRADDVLGSQDEVDAHGGHEDADYTEGVGHPGGETGRGVEVDFPVLDGCVGYAEGAGGEGGDAVPEVGGGFVEEGAAFGGEAVDVGFED